MIRTLTGVPTAGTSRLEILTRSRSALLLSDTTATEVGPAKLDSITMPSGSVADVAVNRSDELVAQLSRSIEEMTAEPMDHQVFLERDTRFHLAIAHAASDTIFENIDSTIQSIVRSGTRVPTIFRRPRGGRSPEHRRSPT